MVVAATATRTVTHDSACRLYSTHDWPWSKLIDLEQLQAESSADMTPKHFKHVIVGGGAMGAATAFFLAKRLGPAGAAQICVIERDFGLTRAASALCRCCCHDWTSQRRAAI